MAEDSLETPQRVAIWATEQHAKVKLEQSQQKNHEEELLRLLNEHFPNAKEAVPLVEAINKIRASAKRVAQIQTDVDWSTALVNTGSGFKATVKAWDELDQIRRERKESPEK